MNWESEWKRREAMRLRESRKIDSWENLRPINLVSMTYIGAAAVARDFGAHEVAEHLERLAESVKA